MRQQACSRGPVLRGAGPIGGPEMPEWGNRPIPRRLLASGVRDMVRICDGRMSGTAYGTVVLHVSPEGAAGGPLSKIRTGDWIVLDVPGRRVDVELPDGELRDRPVAPAMAAAVASPRRGWELLYVDFLLGSSGNQVNRDSH
jgi:dihydroxyacid dehydratase/phosphogluconate dehydratase